MMAEKRSRIEVSVRPIPPSDTIRIRHTVLWPLVPLESQLLSYDFLPTTLHFGAFLDGAEDGRERLQYISTGNEDSVGGSRASQDGSDRRLIAVLTLTLESYQYPDDLPDEIRQAGRVEYQLHKFGVLQEHQGKGIGRRLLEDALSALEDRVTKDHANKRILLHFDARSGQMAFYNKLGFQVLDQKRFMKYGPTGDGPPVEYVRMGKLL